MITDVLKILSEGKNLDYDKTKEVMYEITGGEATEAQIASFLTALKIKGETVDEITAAAEVMRERCIKTDIDGKSVLDIVGTGGDGANTFNISTTTAFVVAAGGVPIAKHGNRALTSKSGSTDVLEACGININKTPEQEKEIFKKLNLCFMFAQNHHPSMKYAANVRRELKFRTLFNILGPLTNPACANYQLFGVYDSALVHKLARVISNLGVENVLVLHGEDGLDEATVCDGTIISECRNGIIKDYSISPRDFGMKFYKPEEIKGGTPVENAEILKNILSGKEKGAKKDIVLLNSGLAFYTFKKTGTIEESIKAASDVIDSGLAWDKFEKYIKCTNEV